MIITKLRGGLGNQLFQFSAGYYFSKKKRTKLLIDSSWYDNISKKDTARCCLVQEITGSDFEIIERGRIASSLLRNRLINKLFLAREEKQFEFCEDIPSRYPLTILDGYWQSRFYADAAREYLRQKILEINLSEEATILAKKIENNRAAVVVHVRRGDFFNKNNLSTYGICTDNYYLNSIKFFLSEIGSNAKFFVFSDDYDWISKSEIFKSNCEIVRPMSLDGLMDFVVMSKASNYVISNSTYSWWAAYISKNTLNESMVLMPEYWISGVRVSSKNFHLEKSRLMTG